MKKAFGAIDLLLGLLIMTALFMLCANVFKTIIKYAAPAEVKSIKEEVDAQVNQIEDMRRQTIDYNKETEGF